MVNLKQESQSTPAVWTLPRTSEFIRKLYTALENRRSESIISWTPSGDAFTVKDIHQFTLSVLPALYTHSNFASFVRQLNKYGFRKVKDLDENESYEHSWTFRHPEFKSGKPDGLANIKRKPQHPHPPQQDSLASTSSNQMQPSTHDSQNINSEMHGHLRLEMIGLHEDFASIRSRIYDQERNYERVLQSLADLRAGMVVQNRNICKLEAKSYSNYIKSLDYPSRSLTSTPMDTKPRKISNYFPSLT